MHTTRFEKKPCHFAIAALIMLLCFIMTKYILTKVSMTHPFHEFVILLAGACEIKSLNFVIKTSKCTKELLFSHVRIIVIFWLPTGETCNLENGEMVPEIWSKYMRCSMILMSTTKGLWALFVMFVNIRFHPLCISIGY